ncbi:MAG: hypothetical protein HUU50_07975 [Candidatus Brocadiae bacterium]|nr:hypothetical protein [Candidatus Brocadiia bacterium]
MTVVQLLKLAKKLRDPEKGCPWDKEQDFDSFKHCLVEEANEVIQAIDLKDWENLKEELGDTLFNLVFLINLAEEKKLFTLTDVVDGIYHKMIHRHPHVFGDQKAKDAQEAYEIFQKAKKKSL